jgi:hypothetical protein
VRVEIHAARVGILLFPFGWLTMQLYQIDKRMFTLHEKMDESAFATLATMPTTNAQATAFILVWRLEQL